MALNREATSDAANACVSELIRKVIDREVRAKIRKQARGPAQRAALSKCLAALVADLLMAQVKGQDGRWSYRALRPAEFSGEAVGYQVVKSTVDALKALKLLEILKGFLNNTFQEDWAPGVAKVGHGVATRMRPTKALLRIANKHGITPDTVSQHFPAQAPKVLLELKGLRPKGTPGIDEPERLKFDHTPKTRAIGERVAAINDFWNKHKLTGGEHLGYKRTFSQGHLPNYRWNKGGRLYSVGGDSYQQMPKSERLQMRIDGEPVVELDVRASYVTVLHGLLNIPFDPFVDPYASDVFDRRFVKKFVTVTLGKGTYPTRWSPNMKKELIENGIAQLPKLRDIRDEVLARSEALRRWPTCGLDIHDLMFTEAEAIIQVVETLAFATREQTPSLSMHDGIIIPESKWEIAAHFMELSFHGKCRVKPCIVMHAHGMEPKVLQRLT